MPSECLQGYRCLLTDDVTVEKAQRKKHIFRFRGHSPLEQSDGETQGKASLMVTPLLQHPPVPKLLAKFVEKSVILSRSLLESPALRIQLATDDVRGRHYVMLPCGKLESLSCASRCGS